MAAADSIDMESGENLAPLDYLSRADEEMAAGNGREAAGLLWKATRATLVGLGRERGLKLSGSGYSDFMELADALESVPEWEKGYFRGNFIAATVLRDHADMEVLECLELDFSYDLTRQFIVECNGDRLWQQQIR